MKGDKLLTLGGVTGALIGGVIAGHLADKVAIQYLKELKNAKDKTDAIKLFKKYTKSTPHFRLLTDKDISRILKEEGNDLNDGQKEAFNVFLNDLKAGNALALPPQELSALNKDYIHERFYKNPHILTSHKVSPSVLGHELGHLIDYEEHEKKPFFARMINKLRDEEAAAWDKSPIPYNEETRKKALSTYTRGTWYPVAGVLAGGSVGAGLTHLIRKGIEGLRQSKGDALHVPITQPAPETEVYINKLKKLKELTKNKELLKKTLVKAAL